MRRSSLVLAATVAALGAVPAAAPAATVAQPGASTSVREYDGTIVFSQFDAADGRWHLSVRQAGADARRLDVASSAAPFSADIGTDSRGRPQLIYRRCDLTDDRLTGCDLFVLSLADASGERPVRNANDPDHDDVQPTLWRGRIAWTRVYGSGITANPVVYTKLLTAPRSQPSRRLPGVPQRRCGDVDPVCGPTTARGVYALELWGDNLGVMVNYECEGCSGISQKEVRLTSVREASARQVAALVTGLNGQFFTGPSFFSGRLAWYRGCAVPEASCRSMAGPWRYRVSARTYERGAAGPIKVDGFADTGSRQYRVLGCEFASQLAPPPPPGSCRIDSVAPPSYAAAPAPLR